jgi:DNA polymerase-3 subunit gamma/tau
MSYTVLARKYRPQAFEEMTGQEHVVRTIENAIKLNRVAHAYLFSGPRGVGKTTAARLLARALNCDKGPTAHPCGACRACIEIRDGSSVDVSEIDGASNNGVENVREIRENARYLPQRDRYKIYIIDEVHMLSTAAFNALLKTLEEPPGHLKFIFATTESHKLPDTILSRCQRHNFRRIPASAMLARLKDVALQEKVNISDSALSMIVSQAEGGMRDALSLLDQLLSACGESPSDEAVAEALGAVDRTTIHHLATALVRREASGLLELSLSLWNKGVDLRRVLDDLAGHLRNLFVGKVTGKAPEELADSDKKALMALANDSDAAELSRLFDIVHQSTWDIVRAAQPRLAFEMALLKALYLAPSAAIPELVARLEHLSGGKGPNPTTQAGAPGGRSAPSNFRA